MGQHISQGLNSERSSVSYTKNPMRGTAVVGKLREAQTVALLEMGVCSSHHLHTGRISRSCVPAHYCPRTVSWVMDKDLHAFVGTLYVRSIARFRIEFQAPFGEHQSK
jgi:hypothetical protein